MTEKKMVVTQNIQSAHGKHSGRDKKAPVFLLDTGKFFQSC